MNDGIMKFRELLLTDEGFQQKLKAAMEHYDGEQTAEAVFDKVLLPLGQEYGISGTFEEFRAFFEQLGEQEINADELSQIAGGTKGAGASFCFAIGLGGGVTETKESGSVCALVGIGDGGSACMGSGAEM